MTLSRPPQPGSRDNRASVILTTSILTAVLILLGIALMWWAVQSGFALAPTPTPTATPRPAYTPTPDARATHVAEDMLTQVAFAATLVGRLTPGAPIAQGPNGVKLPLISAPGTPTPPREAIGQPGAQQGATPLYIPRIENGPTVTPIPPAVQTATAMALYTPPTIAVMPTYTPQSFPTPALPTPAIPPAFPTPALPTPIYPTPVIATPIPPPVIPTPLPPPPTPTPSPVVGGELAATMRGSETAVRVGPSNVYTVTANLTPNYGVRLRGRTPAGDWVYACCLPNSATTFWVRRAYVNISGNSLPAGAPSDADPNDPRWLPVQPVDSSLVVRPTPTQIPLGDFPLARYDEHNTGRVPALPNPPLSQKWTVFQQAAAGFISPVGVSGPSVLASSLDNQFYSLDLNAGTQRWRYNLQNYTTVAPSLQDGLIYIALNNRSLVALQDQGNSAGLIWQSDLPGNVLTAANIWLDTLFIGAGDGPDARLLALRRQNPADRREFTEPNGRVQQPAIGGETIYVGADRLWALDVNFFVGSETIWTSPDVFNVATAPVYASPGVVKLAELYVADTGGTVHALDANTGVQFWTHSFGGQINALAVNETSVFVAGNNVLRALARKDGSTQWTVPVGGQVMGGPLVTSNRVFVATQNGGVFLLDATNGATLDAASSIPAQVPGGPAVSTNTVLIPASNATIYALRSPQ